MRSVTLIDTTFSAAQSAFWRGRATASMLLPVVGRVGAVGFAAVEIMDGDVFQEAVMARRENPWQRIRIAAERSPAANLGVAVHARCLFGTTPLSESVLALGVETLAACGVRRIMAYDSLNDAAPLSALIDLAHKAGMRACAAIVYAPSPGMNDRAYPDLARSLIAAGADSICLWDPAGILAPDAARALIPAVRAAIGSGPLELRCHGSSGLAELVYLEAAEAGIDVLHTAFQPLAGGGSLPPTEYAVEHLSRLGIDVVPYDKRELAEIADYFTALAERHDLPLGVHVLRDFGAASHQLPAPALATLRADVAEADLAARLDEVLAEAARIRAELGFPGMAEPIGGFVCRQAILNMQASERYERLDPGIASYLRGAFGMPSASIDRALAAKAKSLSRADASIDEGRLKANIPDASADDILIAAMCGETASHAMRGAPARDFSEIARADTPLDWLEAELKRRPWVRHLVVRKGDFRFDGGAGPRTS